MSDKQKQLFKTKIVPGKEGSGNLFEEEFVVNSGPVECLGMTFQNDEKRRKYFLEKLREKLKDPEFRKIEGFPIGEDEDILALSDPPYYTACPNPFIQDFIAHCHGDDSTEHPKPFAPLASDVTEGKSDPVYQAHSYHTKVPYKAIQRYIEHFTDKGSLVGDFFCGTGMTGLAAISLGRNAVIGDLSPYATFIARFYNTSISPDVLKHAWEKLLARAEQEMGWLYNYTVANKHSEIQYTVWSDHYFCANCSAELVFWDIAVTKEGKLKQSIKCPKCGVILTKKSLTQVPSYTGEVKRTPVQVYEITKDGRRRTRAPLPEDITVLRRCEKELPNYVYPMDHMMFIGERFGDMYVPRQHRGITRVDQFYLPRSLLAVAYLREKIKEIQDEDVKHFLLWAFLSVQNYLNKKQSYFGGGGGQPGTLTIADIIQEKNVFRVLDRKIIKLIKLANRFNQLVGHGHSRTLITTQSATALTSVPSDSFDYVFTDPPFGRNLMYSELNFINESWIRVFTKNDVEAIINRSQGKKVNQYINLMARSFGEYYRVLKPGRWITVEFHNSSSVIWNGIQESLGIAGFVVAQLAVLDKQEKTFKQLESSAGAVDKDLVISAYKPNGGLEERFKLEAGTKDGVWDFVRTHLKKLPVFVSKDGQAEVIAERQNYLLFDRMVAFHVQRGVAVSMSAAEFYAGLEQRFPLRDGMYFLPDQAAEYDKKRMTVKEVLHLQLFVSDEASAIQWLKQQLTKKPQTFQDIHPQFLKEIGGWQKHEKALELSELLKENFLCYDLPTASAARASSRGEVPSQIHSYLSSNFKEMRNLSKDDPALRAKAKDRWYVPDPNKAGDLEKLRERTLMREFAEYSESKQKRLKVFRLEAVRAGFKKAWQGRDYATIIAVARKIPEKILQEDPKLLMWCDQALTRTGKGE